MLAEEMNHQEVSETELAPLGDRVDPFDPALLAQQLLQKRREMLEEHACGAMATEHTEITEQTSAHQATISKILGLREQLMDNLPGKDDKPVSAVPQFPARPATASDTSAATYQGKGGLSAVPSPQVPPIKTSPERLMLTGPPIETAVPKPRHARFDSLVESQSSPQGVSLLDSLNPSAHVSMLPRHILDSIQLDDALGEEDHSPAGTGRPKRKGPPRIKSRRSRVQRIGSFAAATRPFQLLIYQMHQGITHSAHVSCPIGPVLLGSAFSPIALFPHSPSICRHSEQTYIAVAGARACKELINS
ncbi:hypothetical protein WJX82_003919 [Trebouxia sp. C0006]